MISSGEAWCSFNSLLSSNSADIVAPWRPACSTRRLLVLKPIKLVPVGFPSAGWTDLVARWRHRRSTGLYFAGK